MRPSILPNLIDAAARNAGARPRDPALFEVGPQYKDASPTGQARMAAGVRHNMAVPRNWAGPTRTVDVFDAKADALAVLAAIGAPDNLLASAGAPDWYHPGRSGAIKLGDRTSWPTSASCIPRSSPRPTSRARSPRSRCSSRRRRCPRRRPPRRGRSSTLSPFQPLERDFAFLVDAASRPRSWSAPRATPTRR